MNPMKARFRFTDDVGAALDLAAQSGVRPMDLIVCLGGYIDIVVRCSDGNKQETAMVFAALSDNYDDDAAILPPVGHPIYSPCNSAIG